MKAEAMRIALIRHATREQNGNADKALPLTDSGVAEAAACGSALFERGFFPTVCFTSWYVHARQTAEIISSTIARLESSGGTSEVAAPVVELCALTPQFPGSASWAKTEKWAGVAILEWLISETEKTGYDLSEMDTAVFVMHEPRMRQLLAGMTEGTISTRTFSFSEGICLQAHSLHEFVEGRGKQDGALILREV
jgi:phosphohistidine phosphatase SixA